MGLLERETELSLLEDALTGAIAGQGSAMLIHGEAGIGKSSFIRSFSTIARGRARFLIGSCDDLLTPRTLGPFRDMARDVGDSFATALLGGDTDRDAILAAIRDELAQPATVMIVEDAHWADDATLDVARYFGRRMTDLPSPFVLTYRDDDVQDDHPLAKVLGVFTHPDVHRLGLRPLSRQAVGKLCSRPGMDADALLDATGGNPFFITEVLASPQVEVPATVRDAVLARVGELPEPTQKALGLLSTVPGQAERSLVERLLGNEINSLEQAERRRVLTADSDRIWFRHELARRAIEQTLPPTARVACNRRVLEALGHQGHVELSRLVHHASEANEPEAVIKHGLAAAREAAAAGAHHAANSHYERVLSTSGNLSEAERATVIEESAWILYHLYRFDQAAARAREAVTSRERLGDQSALAQALTTLSRTLYMINDPGGSEEAVTRAVELLAPLGDTPALADAYSYLAAIQKLTDRPDDAIEHAKRAIEIGEGTGRQDIVADSLNYLGCALIDSGDPGGIQHLRRSVAIARAIHHHEYEQRGYTNLVESLYRIGSLGELDDSIERGLAHAREYDFPSHEYNLEAHRCMLATLRGHWEEAETGLRKLKQVEDAGVLASFGLSALGRLLARKGDADARDILERAWQSAARTNSVQSIALAGIALVEWAWLNGEPDTAWEFAEVPLDRTGIVGAERYRGELLRILVRCGHPNQSFDGCPREYELGIKGQWREAADLWGCIGAPYERALELADSRRPAEMLKALAVLEQLGAGPAAKLVRTELKNIGVTNVPRLLKPRRQANPAGLTDRQVEVLALVTEGLTNAEIADRLVVSVRTVDHHVSAILRGLEVGTRREAARTAARLGITAPQSVE